MLIALIIILVVLVDSCNTPPERCFFVTECVSSCATMDPVPFDFDTCTCPAGSVDRFSCSTTFDAGPPTPPPPFDGGDCETWECFRPYECVSSCGEEPFYVGCCECPSGSFDRVFECADAGPPPVEDGGSGLLPLGAECFDGRQCETAQCYGTIGADGMTNVPTCQASCIASDATDLYCLTSLNCCDGRICDVSGACTDAMPPPAP